MPIKYRVCKDLHRTTYHIADNSSHFEYVVVKSVEVGRLVSMCKRNCKLLIQSTIFLSSVSFQPSYWRVRQGCSSSLVDFALYHQVFFHIAQRPHSTLLEVA